MKLTINTAAGATISTITDLANNTPAEILDIFVGDILNLELAFSDGAGNLADFTGRADNKIIVAVGTIADRNAMAHTATMIYENGVYKASLNLDTTALKNYIGTQPSTEIALEVQISYAGNIAAPGIAETETLCQQPIILRNQVIK